MAAARAVLEAADRQPLILAIEDLHWADDSTLGLLEHLAAVVTQQAALTPVPLALILTSRRLRGRGALACHAANETGSHLPGDRSQRTR